MNKLETHPLRLTLVISSLSGGGAERIMSVAANDWTQRGHQVTLITLESAGQDFYTVDDTVHRIGLGLLPPSRNILDVIRNNWKRIRLLRTSIRESRPDVIISFIDIINIMTLLASAGLRVPVVVREAVQPGSYSLGWLRSTLRLWTYRSASRVVVLTDRGPNFFTGKVKRNCRVIPNPVMPAISRDDVPEYALTKPCVVAMGRLDAQKGFDILLQAFARVGERYPDWSLTILGEGPDRSALEQECRKLDLSARVHMPGLIKNPQAVLRQADLYVLSSRYEGFPNALCEAMACGLPVIATDCPSGPREIIRVGIDGILVPVEDVSALATAMENLIVDNAQRQRLASRAAEITERFSLDRVMCLWDDLFREILEGESK
ncbi:MAG: glycosyltransferase family 4 protein [Armatimonadota bacterium]|nr:glycosyltransferase family 4 protein [Armatimonadota bacterium]